MPRSTLVAYSSAVASATARTTIASASTRRGRWPTAWTARAVAESTSRSAALGFMGSAPGRNALSAPRPLAHPRSTRRPSATAMRAARSAGVSKAGRPAGTATSAPSAEPPNPVDGLPLVAGATPDRGSRVLSLWRPRRPRRRCHRRPSPSRATDETADVLPFDGTMLVRQRAVMTVRHPPSGAWSPGRHA
jgi:hypothetical protein